MRFSDVIGHADVAARLRAVARGDAGHAYLLHGPEGIGKRALADAFAALLLCEEGGDDACGRCRHCVRIAAATHPDLLVIAREEDRRDIRVEQARAIVRWLALRPMMARRKVVIVDGAHLLNEHGQNALLKTLEEPPGASVLLLLAPRAALLLPTIRSRCQLLAIEPLPTDTIASALRACGEQAEVAALAAAQAGGSLGRALALAGAEHGAMRRRVLGVLVTLPARGAHELSALAQEIARGPLDAALDVVVAWYRDVLARACDTASPAARNPDLASEVAAAAARTAPEVVLRQLEEVCATLQALDRNANRVLALETLLLALRRLERDAERLSP